MNKTVSIDMSTCDEDFGNRIFGKVIEQEGDNLICEFLKTGIIENEHGEEIDEDFINIINGKES